MIETEVARMEKSQLETRYVSAKIASLKAQVAALEAKIDLYACLLRNRKKESGEP